MEFLSRNKFTFLILFFTQIQFGYAAFLVEPGFIHYQGKYERGDNKGDLTADVTSLNLGYLGEYFMIGLGLERGHYVLNRDATPSDGSFFEGGGVGTFIGFYFLDKFRIITNYLNSNLEPINNNNQRYFGQHIAIGLGYRLYDGLMLNYHSFNNYYTQLEDDDTGKTTGLDTNIRTKGQALSLSYILIF